MVNQDKKQAVRYIVVGVFDCGCEWEANIGSVEIVSCKDKKEVRKVKKLMRVHSSEFQCQPAPARVLFTVDGKIKGVRVKPFKNYVQKWELRHQETLKLLKDYFQLLSKEKDKISKMEARKCLRQIKKLQNLRI